MAVNLYSSPAQAEFINTYVPIKFEMLNRLSDQNRAEYKEAEASLGKLVDDYSYLDTPSKASAEIFGEASESVRSFIETNLNDPDFLKTSQGRAQIASLTRKLKGDQVLARAIGEAPKLAAFVRQSDENWGDIEARKAVAYDPRSGSFNERNVKFATIDALYDPAVNNLRETELFNNGKIKTTGISEDQIYSAVDGYTDAIKNDARLQMHLQMFKEQGNITPYLVRDKDGNVLTDENGEPVIDERRLMVDMAYSSTKDRAFSKTDYDQLWLENKRQQHAFSLLRAKQAYENNENTRGNPYATQYQIATSTAAANADQYFSSVLKNAVENPRYENGKLKFGFRKMSNGLSYSQLNNEEKAALETAAKQLIEEEKLAKLNARRLAASNSPNANQNELAKIDSEIADTYQRVQNGQSALSTIGRDQFDRYANKQQTPFMFSEDDYTNATSVSMDNSFISAYNDAAYNSPKALVLPDGTKLDTRSITPGTRVSVRSGFESGVRSSDNIAMEIANAITDGKIVGDFQPSRIVTPTENGQKLNHRGVMYLSSEAIKAAIGEDKYFEALSRGLISPIEKTSIKPGGVITTSEIVRIPVSTEGMDMGPSSRAWGSMGNVNENRFKNSSYIPFE